MFQMLDFEYNGIYEKLLDFLKTDCIFCKVNTQNNFKFSCMYRIEHQLLETSVVQYSADCTGHILCAYY